MAEAEKSAQRLARFPTWFPAWFPARRGWFRGAGDRASASLRLRLVLAATAAVVVGIGAGVGFAYLAISNELTGNMEQRLQQQARELCHAVVPASAPGVPPSITAHGDDGHQPDHTDDDYVQFVPTTGATVLPPGQGVPLPADAADRAVAAGASTLRERDITLTGAAASTALASGSSTGDLRIRVLTLPAARGWAVQVGAPMGQVDDELAHIGLLLVFAGIVGVVLAALLGGLVARTALGPVVRLTAATERIATTRDLDHRITAGWRGELGRLARSFNAMLDALRESTQAQQRLVVDASHELRTPLTSVRTNVEMLARADRLEPEDRQRVLDGAILGLRELTALINDLVELARGEEQSDPVEDLSFDGLVRQAASRARTHWPGVDIVVDAEPAVVRGARSRLDVAVRNLLDNAAKFSPPGGSVQVAVRTVEEPVRGPGIWPDRAGAHTGRRAAVVMTVRDHGPGIPADDLPFVFDRFFRSPEARGKPGSGLGLAIARQVADRHAGTVAAAAAEGGGTVVTLTLPAVASGE